MYLYVHISVFESCVFLYINQNLRETRYTNGEAKRALQYEGLRVGSGLGGGACETSVLDVPLGRFSWIWGLLSMGVPQNGWFIMEKPTFHGVSCRPTISLRISKVFGAA